VYHYETDGTYLGFFDVTIDPFRFIDGLEFQGVPVPPSVLLLGSGLIGLVGWRRFRKG